MSVISANAKMPISKQNKIINTYLSDKRSDAIYRVFLSLTDKKVLTYAVPKLVKDSLGLAVVGGVGGALIGGSLAGVSGAVKGAAIGATVLGVATITYNLCTIPRSDAFKEWLGKAIKSEVFPMFLDFIQDDQEVAEFFCAITHDYPDVPVRLPDGQVYEKAAILHWLRNYVSVPGWSAVDALRDPNWYNASSPIRKGNREYTSADLLEATQHFSRIIDRMRGIRNRVLGQMAPNDIRRQGLEALYNDLVGDFNAYSSAYDARILGEAEAGQRGVDEAEALLMENARSAVQVKVAALRQRIKG